MEFQKTEDSINLWLLKLTIDRSHPAESKILKEQSTYLTRTDSFFFSLSINFKWGREVVMGSTEPYKFGSVYDQMISTLEAWLKW